MADSASAPAPAPATGRGRPASAAPGPIELADEKTVQTLATPDSFGAPLANHVLTTTYAPAKFRLERRKRARHKYMAPTTRTHPAPPYPPLTIVNRS